MRGLTVRIQKFDPYLNVIGHDEPVSTRRGLRLEYARRPIDLGNMKRFTSGKLSRLNSLSSGRSTKT